MLKASVSLRSIQRTNATIGKVLDQVERRGMKDALMKKHGFIKCKTDPCLYFKCLRNDDLLMTTVYVDDCIANGPSDETIH